jgi:hypothetical protein
MSPPDGAGGECETVADAPVDSPGPALLVFQGDKRLQDVDVIEYELQVDGGVPRDLGPKSFTGSAKWTFGKEHSTPVASNGNLRLLSTRRLQRTMTVKGRTVEPVEVETRTLDPSNPTHREQLEDLVQADLRLAIPSETYDFRFLNDIRKREPAFVAESGAYAAHLNYVASIDMTADGVPLLQVEISHEQRPLETLDEMYSPGDSLPRVKVQHDSDVYNETGSGQLLGWSDHRYTDHIDDMGDSIAGFQASGEKVDPEVGARLREENPRLVRVDYGSYVGRQLPHVLTMTASLDQVKDNDNSFHDRFTSEKALQPGERYRHAAAFTRSVTRLPTFNVSFVDKPRAHGYRGRSYRRGEPRLVYADGQRGGHPRLDLPKFGAYETPNYRVRLIAPSTDHYEKIREQLPGVIARGLADIGAPAHVTGGATYAPGDTSNYTEAASDLPDDTDVAIAVVPPKGEAEASGLFEDPHPELKRRLMRRGVPTQMMEKETAESLVGTSPPASNHTFANILSAIATKAGATPWMVADFPGSADAFLGLDVSRKGGKNAGAAASVVLPDGATFAAEFTTFQDGETFRAEDLTTIVRDLVFDFAASDGHNIEHLAILRDGKISEDVDAFREGVASLDIDVDVVGVRKSGQPRVGHWTGDGWRIADKGVAFIDQDRDRSVLHSWGKPDCGDTLSTGTPKTIGIWKHSGPADIATLTEQAYWLSEMHYGSPARSTRLPVPINYADKAAEYVREGYADKNSIIEGPAYL